MDRSAQITGARYGETHFPRYDNAPLGLKQRWYPVMFSRALGGKPVSLRLFGEDVAFFRDGGKAYAVLDRCPHRGIPLSLARKEFPGTISCVYHGWTFDLKTGVMVAALTDGADSPIAGKRSVRTFPVEERAGLVWLFYGSGTPTPLESDIPEELLREDAVLQGRFTDRPGDWRYAAENGIDEGHVKFLHRNALFVRFFRAPSCILSEMVPQQDGWVLRQPKTITFGGDYPGLGWWPKPSFWKFLTARIRVSIRLPGMLRVFYGAWYHFEWYYPSENGRHRYGQIALKHAPAFGRLLFRIRYWLYIRWVLHVLFNNQDSQVVQLMKTPPEQLYRPDNSIIAWRRMCERDITSQEGT
jgi:phenylpropionate dioxygenase-like ring-hydroxylating dioxygenase large terminal subunit